MPRRRHQSDEARSQWCAETHQPVGVIVGGAAALELATTLDLVVPDAVRAYGDLELRHTLLAVRVTPCLHEHSCDQNRGFTGVDSHPLRGVVLLGAPRLSRVQGAAQAKKREAETKLDAKRQMVH